MSCFAQSHSDTLHLLLSERGLLRLVSKNLHTHRMCHRWKFVFIILSLFLNPRAHINSKTVQDFIMLFFKNKNVKYHQNDKCSTGHISVFGCGDIFYSYSLHQGVSNHRNLSHPVCFSLGCAV